MDFNYTDERNIQILISLLKQHNIKKVIASPGGTNTCFVASIQQDPFFEIYSAVDERSAAYIACGMAAEMGGKEVVVLSCTGATASRNYMSALTEAYYRKLPILAVTSSKRNFEIGHLVDQVTDRTVLPRDVAKISVQMPFVHDNESEWGCTIAANKAILELFHHGGGPAHINLETTYSKNYTVKNLPAAKQIKRYTIYDNLPELNADKIAIMVGAHNVWTDEEIMAVDSFCDRYNAVVLCDHTSNYKGKYRIFPSLAARQKNYMSVVRTADLVIHIGEVSSENYEIRMQRVWRVNPDGELRDTYKKLDSVFEMNEQVFFEEYARKKSPSHNDYYKECLSEQKELIEKLSDLPFSNAWIAESTIRNLPQNSVLHLGIRNSLRFWDCFESALTLEGGYSNTGGFGIDGCLSSTIGASLIHKDKIYYCVLGDLAFFYDMNCIGNRHIGNNLRVILINNGGGAEFLLSSSALPLFGSETYTYIAAAGHYGNQSKVLVKHFCEDLGFDYLSAQNKDEYKKILPEIINPNIGNKPLFVEIFTIGTDEDSALQILSELEKDDVLAMKNSMKKMARKVIGESAVSKIRKKFIL